jgi:hypothetical protein
MGRVAPERETPLVPGPLYGLRTWTVVGERGEERLAGPHRRTPWPAGGAWLRSACARDPAHAAPVHDCVCGIHAWHPDQRGARRALATRREVAGIVEAAGTVEVHPDGFRAERGRPHALVLVPGRNAALVGRLARAYGAEVAEVRGAAELVELCRERRLGLEASVVDELLGPGRVEAWRRASRRKARLDAARLTAALLAAAVIAAIALEERPDPSAPPDTPGETGRAHVR